MAGRGLRQPWIRAARNVGNLSPPVSCVCLYFAAASEFRNATAGFALLPRGSTRSCGSPPLVNPDLVTAGILGPVQGLVGALYQLSRT